MGAEDEEERGLPDEDTNVLRGVAGARLGHGRPYQVPTDPGVGPGEVEGMKLRVGYQIAAERYLPRSKRLEWRNGADRLFDRHEQEVDRFRRATAPLRAASLRRRSIGELAQMAQAVAPALRSPSGASSPESVGGTSARPTGQDPGESESS